MSSESNTHADTSAEEVVENADSTATFKAVVSLPDEVNVATGEENDETLFKSRARLYRFAAETKEWKERGTGDVKFLKNKESNVVRCVMRQEKTNKLCLNHNVNPLVEIKPNAGSETSWVFTIDDFAEGSAKLDTFAIRFKTVELAESFKKMHDDARESNKDPSKCTLKALVVEESNEKPATATSPTESTN